MLGADLVPELWREALTELFGSVEVRMPAGMQARVPLSRLLPTALVAPASQVVVTPSATPAHWPTGSHRPVSADGQPPAGIDRIQQEVAYVYQLADAA